MSRLSSSGMAARCEKAKILDEDWERRREREISEAKSVSRRCENGQRQTRKREGERGRKRERERERERERNDDNA